VISSFPTCPIPEVARLGRTLKQRKAAILACFDTSGASNGPTEAIKRVIETTRRIARGFRNFTNYRPRCLVAAGGHRPYRKHTLNHAYYESKLGQAAVAGVMVTSKPRLLSFLMALFLALIGSGVLLAPSDYQGSSN
jgi:hypothetical protein